MARYVKKPIVIEAVQWDGNWTTLEPFADLLSNVTQNLGDESIAIETPEGTTTVEVGDWIIRGVSNELYSCADLPADDEASHDGG